MSLVFDEYGRPFIIMREQETKGRLKGIEAQKANILAARTVSQVLRSSLGPRGMDKYVCRARARARTKLRACSRVLSGCSDSLRVMQRV